MTSHFGCSIARSNCWRRRLCAASRALAFVFTTLICGSAAGANDPANSPAPDATDRASRDRLAAVEAKASDIRDLSADFVEIKKTILLKNPLRSSGTVVASGGRTKWVTREPHNSWLCTTAEHVTIYFPDEKRAERYPVDAKLRPLLISPVPQTDRLRESFTIEQVGGGGAQELSADQAVLRLALRPKTEELRELIEQIRVDIDEERGVASRVRIFDADGDVTTIEFRNVRINDGVGSADLNCTLPPQTELADFSDEGARRP